MTFHVAYRNEFQKAEVDALTAEDAATIYCVRHPRRGNDYILVEADGRRHIIFTGDLPISVLPHVDTLSPGRRAGVRAAFVVMAVFGLLLVVAGLIQWNSAESQIRRGFGREDSTAVPLFIFGIPALLIGLFGALLLSGQSPPAPSTEANPSTAEERLRQLDESRSKGLLSDAEYEQHRKDIIASL